MSDDADTYIFNLKLSLAKLRLDSGQQLNMIDFEKDDDTNHHVEFVTAASNLRAECYDIPQADAMRTKQIAGRIIPALATTTAVVAGLISIELYKMVGKDGRACPKVPLERFKSGFLNMAGPFYTFSEPGRAPLKRYNEHDFTLWDRLELHGPKTLQELIDWVNVSGGGGARKHDDAQFSVDDRSSSLDVVVGRFAAVRFLPAAGQNRRAYASKVCRSGGERCAVRRAQTSPFSVLDVVADVTRTSIPPHRKTIVFDAVTTGDDDEDVDIPFIKYYI